MMRRTPALAAVVVAVTLALSGCSFRGVNSYSLPFSKGGSDDAVQATVLLENATNLVPNSEVKYGEVTIGSVRKIELDGWNAKLTIGLEKDARVPADVTAKVAQKSLLGAEYLELKDPPSATQASGTLLADGAVIGLDRTERYPETEEVLTAASLLFNGGGLPQLKVITEELNTAFTGRTGDARSLVRNIDRTAGKLNAQRRSIFSAMEQLRELSATANRDTGTIERALDTLPAGVESVEAEREALTATLESFSRIERISRTALADNGEDLGTILNNLRPVTDALVGAGSDLPRVAELLTYPFPTGDLYKYTRSDYLNLFATFRINSDSLQKTFIGLTPLDGLMTGFMGLPTGPASEATNPLTSPTDPLTGTVKGLTEATQDLVDGLLGGLSGKPPKSDPKASETQEPSPNPNLLDLLLGGK